MSALHAAVLNAFKNMGWQFRVVEGLEVVESWFEAHHTKIFLHAQSSRGGRRCQRRLSRLFHRAEDAFESRIGAADAGQQEAQPGQLRGRLGQRPGRVPHRQRVSR